MALDKKTDDWSWATGCFPPQYPVLGTTTSSVPELLLFKNKKAKHSGSYSSSAPRTSRCKQGRSAGAPPGSSAGPLATKIWCFWTVVLEKTLERPLDCKEIKPVKPKGNQSWIFTGSTDAEAETPIFWPPDAKNWLNGKDPHAGKDWRQEEKGRTEDEVVRWHHRLDGREFEQAPGVGDGQGSLACCSPWGRKKESDATELNWAFGSGESTSYGAWREWRRRRNA